VGAAAGGESGRLNGRDRAGTTEICQLRRGDLNDDRHVAQYLLSRRARDEVGMGMVGVPVII
jgi:hypothetical protein